MAGFTREHQDDAHRLSLDDHTRAREALTQLHQTAQDCQTKVITSERSYFGDIAHAVAEALPGQWDVSIEHYPDGTVPAQLLDWVWEASPVLTTLAKYRSPGAAILRDGGGTELLLAEGPWDGRYLIGTLVPSPDHLNVVGAGPRTINATTAQGAAADVRSRLLPEFEQMVHRARLREVQEDLTWVREDVEPGTVAAVDLDAALDRFLTHLPYLIAAARRADAKPSTPQHAAVLDRFDALLTSPPHSSSTDTGLEPGGTDEVLALWLEDGQDLIDLVRAATVPPAEASSRPVVTTAVPPKPPAAVAAGRTR